MPQRHRKEAEEQFKFDQHRNEAAFLSKKKKKYRLVASSLWWVTSVM